MDRSQARGFCRKRTAQQGPSQLPMVTKHVVQQHSLLGRCVPWGGSLMMLSSAKRLYRKGLTSFRVSGPPRFRRSTPTFSCA